MRRLLQRVTCGLVALAFPLVAVGTAGAQEELKDRDITLAVETQLTLEEAVPAHRIDVETDAGVVTLSGEVDSYLAKLAAEDEAEEVRGVVGVVNMLEVDVPERTDARIRSDVVTALAADPATEAFEISVAVDDGEVTLSGEVDSWAEKTLAADVARDISGVVDVANELTYEVTLDQADPEIREAIEQRLRSDASLDSGLIGVTVNDGVVTLTGSVASAAEKTEASTEAWMVAGVEEVNNNLEVQWWLDADETSDWGPEWTDGNAAAALRSALAINPRVESFNVNVTVDDGVATLTGQVDNLEAKDAASEEALDTLGIWRVKNHLRVRPSDTRTDSAIAQDVREMLDTALYVDDEGITVTVAGGLVYLGGEVESEFAKERAESVASGVAGVIAVDNNLQVERFEQAKADAAIEEDIRDELFWSPFVDSDDVAVQVSNGVATLRGDVEDWSEYQSAEENAYEGGAVSVTNLLEIEYGNPVR